MGEQIFEARGCFDVHVYIEDDAIDKDTGALALSKIYLYAKPSFDVRDLDVTATISTQSERFVGTLTAHMGPVDASQGHTYPGTACDASPSKMIAGAGAKLTATVTVIYVATTGVKVVPVEPYPPLK